MPTPVIRYLRPAGNTSGGDGTTDAVSGSTRAYASFTDFRTWLVTTYPNLVTADVDVELRVIGTVHNGNASYAAMNLVTDATHGLTIVAYGAPHDGVYNAGADRFTYSVASLFTQPGCHLTLRRLVLEYTGTSQLYGSLFNVSAVAGTDVHLDQCVIVRNPSLLATGDVRVFTVNATSSGGKVRCRLTRSLILGPWRQVATSSYTGHAESGLHVANCTAIGVLGGIQCGSASDAAKLSLVNNRIELHPTEAWTDAYVLTKVPAVHAGNCSSDGSSPQAELRFLTGTFVDANGGDYRPLSTDPASATGVSQAASTWFPFTTDLRASPITTWMSGALAPMLVTAPVVAHTEVVRSRDAVSTSRVGVLWTTGKGGVATTIGVQSPGLRAAWRTLADTTTTVQPVTQGTFSALGSGVYQMTWSAPPEPFGQRVYYLTADGIQPWVEVQDVPMPERWYGVVNAGTATRYAFPVADFALEPQQPVRRWLQFLDGPAAHERVQIVEWTDGQLVVAPPLTAVPVVGNRFVVC